MVVAGTEKIRIQESNGAKGILDDLTLYDENMKVFKIIADAGAAGGGTRTVTGKTNDDGRRDVATGRKGAFIVGISATENGSLG